MKNRFFLLLSLFFSCSLVLAQSPELIRFQAVARDVDGDAVSGNIEVRLSVLEDDPAGIAAYVDETLVTANERGVFTVNIGENPKEGSMGNINWPDHTYFLKAEIRRSVPSGWEQLGEPQQIISVPYAIYGRDEDADPGNELQIITNIGNHAFALSGGGGSFSVNDGDADDANELQTLTLSGESIYLNPAGGSVNLSPILADITWYKSGTSVYYNNGNVGIGYTAPHEKLHVDGKIKMGSAERMWDGGLDQIMVSSSVIPEGDGLYYQKLGASDHRWDEVWAVDGSINTSDRREKTDIQTLNYGLNEILKLEPVRFSWKEKPYKGEKLGLIAQDLLNVLPEVVRTKEWVPVEEGSENMVEVEAQRMGVMYDDIIPVLVKAIQEQQAQIKALQKELDTLKQELDK